MVISELFKKIKYIKNNIKFDYAIINITKKSKCSVIKTKAK